METALNYHSMFGNLADHGVRKSRRELGNSVTLRYEDFSAWSETKIPACPEFPSGEKYYGWSPYHYCMNNPMLFVDPNGMFKIPASNDIGPIMGQKAGNYNSKFPILVNILKVSRGYLEENKPLLALISQYTSQEESDVLDDFTLGDGPTVFAESIIQGGYHKTSGKLTITSGHLFDARSKRKGKVIQAAEAFFSFKTIVHEYLHDKGVKDEEIVEEFQRKAWPGIGNSNNIFDVHDAAKNKKIQGLEKFLNIFE